MQLNYKCDYCGKAFAKEKTLFVHVCEPKRRHMAKNEKHVQYGLLTFRKFYEFNQPSAKPKDFDAFVGSPYYNAFVKFGSFISNVKPLYPEKYIDYVVTSGVKLDHWCRDEMYEKYAIELIQKEGVETALERSVITMMEWADENEPAPWNHYFNHISLNRAVWHIKDGKMSPWLLLNCASGKNMLGKFNDEQLQMIFHIVDPSHWALRFKRQQRDVDLVKEVVKESNL